MDNILIPVVEDEYDKPFVSFNASTGKCEISGESFPEKTAEFYGRLMEWIEQYIKEVKGPIDFDFSLSYFNTSSSKRILHIMILLQEYTEKGGDVTAQWNYDPEDLDLEEDIEDLKIISKLDLKMNPIGGETRFKKMSDEDN
ncbi:DUF1987 domain-containing protein [Bacteroidota bacterium]